MGFVKGLMGCVSLLFLLLLAPNVQSAELMVCPSGCNHTTIQYAVDNASSGDIIKVGAGTYNENIVIDIANLTLISTEFETMGSITENTTLINGGGIEYVAVTITADGVTLQGFTIFNYRWGVYVEDSSATIDNCIIYNTGVYYVETPRDYESGRGIYVYITQASSSFVNITDNVVYDNWRGSAGSPSSRMNMAGRGIYVNSDAFGENCSALIDNNEVYGSDQSGIYVRKVTATVTNNYVHDNGFDGLDEMQWCVGIMVGYSEGTNLIENNTIERIKAPWTQYGSISSGGIIIYGVTWSEDPHYGLIRVNNNTIDTGSASSGINIHNPSDDDWDIYITDNTVSGTTGDPREMLPTWGGIQVWNTKRVYSINSSTYADIYTCDEYTTHVDVIEGNTVTENEVGIVINNSEVSSFHSNMIYNNTEYDINVSDSGEVNATDNWWGLVIPNISKISDNVTYYPFCLDAECLVNINEGRAEFTGGETTNFSEVSNWSSVDLCLEGTDGMINWTDNVNLSDSNLNFGEYADISYRRISVDIGNMPELNQPATLTFRNTGFTGTIQFTLYRNGVLCPESICTSVGVTDTDDVVVIVTQMSDYVLQDSPLYRNLAESGEGLGNFITAITSPVVSIILGLGIVGGIVAILLGVAFALSNAFKGVGKVFGK